MHPCPACKRIRKIEAVYMRQKTPLTMPVSPARQVLYRWQKSSISPSCPPPGFMSRCCSFQFSNASWTSSSHCMLTYVLSLSRYFSFTWPEPSETDVERWSFASIRSLSDWKLMLVLTTSTIVLPADGQCTLTLSCVGMLDSRCGSGGDIFLDSIDAGVSVPWLLSKEEAGVMVRESGGA